MSSLIQVPPNRNGPPSVPSLKKQFRCCAHCQKIESHDAIGFIARFRVCGGCKINRYCSLECQRTHWPIHKARCKENVAFQEDTKKYDEFVASEKNERPGGGKATLPLSAIYPILQDWTETYRPLMCLSLVNALGLCDGPPKLPDAFFAPPQVFLVHLSVVPGLSARTKGRATFRVEKAEVVSVADFRLSAKHQSHRLYNRDNAQLMVDYDRHKNMMNKAPNKRLSMVVQRTYFHNGVSAMNYSKNWYFEDDCLRDYSDQWKPADWLAFLKDTVAAGKGWNRSDIYF